jgi:hypothetical protein
MANSAEPVGETIGRAGGRWSYTLTINAAALVACRFLFSGFEIHGVLTYLAAAAALELPTIVWLLAAHPWKQTMLFNQRWTAWPLAAQRRWLRTWLVVYIAIPFALSTTAPGLAVAAWITSLTITNIWTFIGASAITAAVTISLGPSPARNSVWRLWRSFGREQQGTPAKRGPARRLLGQVIGLSVLVGATVSAVQRGGWFAALAALFVAAGVAALVSGAGSVAELVKGATERPPG